MKTKSKAGLAVIRVTTWLGLLVVAIAGRGSESFIISGSAWKYLATGTDPGTAWRAPAFNDSAWPVGLSQLGFGDGDEQTVLPPGIVTAYFRTKFNVINAAGVGNLTLRVLRDDGAAVYLNGVEVFRNNLPPGPLTYTTLATAAIGGPEETTVFLTAELGVNSLVEGENVIAAEVHQVNVTSSDLSFDLELLANGGGGSTNVNTNLPPVVQLVAPSDGAVFNAPANIQLFANANDPNGYLTLKYVEFFEGANSLGIRTNFPVLNPLGPFVLQWSSVPVGEYTLTAVAVDDHAAKTTSAPVHVSVRSTSPLGTNALIAPNSVWKYLDNGTDQGVAWRAPGFDDSSWASGPGQLGYGDGDEATIVSFGPDSANKYITTYFRHRFVVTDASAVSNLTAQLIYDDAAVVYLNGAEVFRVNLPPGPIVNTTLAPTTPPDNAVFTSSVSPGLLVNGTNVVAVEVHQSSVASSDLSFDLELTGQLGGTNNPPPARRPVVTITEPANGVTFVAPTSVVFSAQAIHDPLSTSRWLDLYLGTNRVGGTAGGGLNVTQKSTVYLHSLPAGDHVLTATARDNLGQRGTSAPVTITIAIPPNTPPTVRIVSPVDGAVLAAASALPIRAEAVFDPASTMKSLEWYRDFHLCTYRDYGTNNVVGGTCIDYIAHPGRSYAYTAVASDNFGNFVTSPPVRVTIVSNLPPAGDRELHVVGIYSGAAAGGGPVHNNEVGDAAVSVDRSGRRVTLYLASYEPTRWHVSVAPGTVIERVFTSSYYSNTVIGLPGDVPIITTRLGFAGYSLDSADYLRALPHFCADAGQDLSSFHGSYTAPYPAPFVIDGVQNDPRLRCDYPQPVPTNNLPAINFRLAFHGSGRGLYFQNYTLAGPRGAFDLLPDVLAVPDSDARFYYAADFHFVWRIDGQSGDVRDMELPPTVPELSWPMGIAFDSLRERALLVSLGGEGFLYAYSPGADAWSLVSSMNNRDLDSLVYHAPLDSLFGVANPYSSDAPVLHEFGPDGLPRRTIPLPNQPERIVQGSVRSELVSVGEYLVLLLGPRYRWDTEQEQRMYLIDPRTGEVWLTYRRVGPPPNSPPVVTITNPSNGAAFSAEEMVSLRVNASDPDGAIASVEFFLNGNSQGDASGPNGSTQGIWDMQLSGLLPGTYHFAAKATDNLGAMTTSFEVTFSVRPPVDTDGDGVSDGRDLCPNTVAGAVVNADGCSLAQLCPCDGGWQNHGEYVRCVIDHAWQFFRAGLITADQRRAAIRAAADSDCGRRPPAAEPMQMHLLPLTPAECHATGVQFVVSGDASGECVVETSTDLTNWTSVQTISAATVGCEIACPNSARSGSEPARFFRVRVAAP